jgi:allophanate hydrolase subunit 2
MAGTLTLTCLKPGGGAYVVDGGRPGHRAIGVAAGGPADGRAMVAANRLLGRNPHATCLETTLSGGQWLLSGEGQLAITGSDMTWRLNGRILETYSVLFHEGDGLLTSLPANRGLRSYLAINGHWQLSKAMGSAEAGLPGVPAVTAGWSVDIKWSVAAGFRTDLDVYQHVPEASFALPVIPGPEWEWLSSQQQKNLLASRFTVGRSSNRQGIRLKNPDFTPMGLPSLISSPVLPGTVQLTPNGPILLGPDAQTVGGYPRVLIVADRRSLGAAFQLGLGDSCRFML